MNHTPLFALRVAQYVYVHADTHSGLARFIAGVPPENLVWFATSLINPDLMPRDQALLLRNYLLGKKISTFDNVQRYRPYIRPDSIELVLTNYL